MFGIETIKQMNREAAERARESGDGPIRIDWPEDIMAERFPFLGDACEDIDAEHALIEDLFCDSSGFGSEGEPALTVRQLRAKLEGLLEEHGSLLCAVREAGQFQCYLAVWKA